MIAVSSGVVTLPVRRFIVARHRLRDQCAEWRWTWRVFGAPCPRRGGHEAEEVHRSPYEEWFLSTHPVEDPGLEIEGGAAMGSGLSDICVHRADNICPNTVNTFRTDSHAVRYPFTSGAP